MAVQNYIIKVRQGNKETFVETQDLEVALKALGVDGINISKDGNGNLVVDAPIIAPAGTGPEALALQGDLTAEVDRATAAEGVLQDNIDTNSAAIAQEISDRGDADTVLQNNIDAEEARATAAEGALDTRLTTAEGEIDDLQTDLAAILANTPKEQLFTADGIAATLDATAPGLLWDADNAVRDIEVEIDGRTQERSVAGDFSDGVWRKNSTTQIEFNVVPEAGRRIRIWKQGTSSGSGGGGGGAGQSAGNPANAFFLLDQDDMVTVWKVSVNNGVLDLEAV